MNDTRPMTMPSADHLMALVTALRREDAARIDALVQPWNTRAEDAAVLVVATLDLASRVAAYTGQGITYDAVDGAPLGVLVGTRMGTLVQGGDAGGAWNVFVDAAMLATDSGGWFSDVLAVAVGGLDRALRLTVPGGA